MKNGFEEQKNSENSSPSFGFLRGHIGGHFHLSVTFARVIDGYFKALGGFVGDPVCAALFTNEGWHIADNNHPEAEMISERGCAFYF